MRAEIIAVGTEILLGEITNTTTPFVARELADLGIDVYYQSVIGDNAERLEAAIKLADSRSELIILTGGLGPTKDDLTKQTLAAHLNEKLVVDAPAMAYIEEFFARSKRPMTENNRLQAMLPANSTPLKNPVGMAVGALYQAPAHTYMLLPGPPSELEAMFIDSARPILVAKFKQASVLESRVLRFHGIGESALVTQLADLIDSQTNPTIAPYAKTNEVTLRLTAEATDQANAQQLLIELEAEVQARVGAYFYGYGEHNSLEQVVVQLLKQRNLTITAAESLTSGLFQSMIANVSGASTVFNGGFVTYSLAEKAHLLQIDAAQLHKYGVVSQETALAMARQAKQIMQTDIAISFTGVAGPDTLEGQPAGTVYIGIAYRDQAPIARKFSFSKSRNSVRQQSALMGFDLLYHLLVVDK
ncbi:competence/damage-inducible protein A [Loigolactobacillus binensis]|uniref:Putative competence-damage inducible protein n=1 Tax=Loigolactobacillus binensis TaxID=2559922 RepID=A0ABW3E9V0_9LACO|nr:competence/damage-inducible protein A [Loigolactobacillus binensis]